MKKPNIAILFSVIIMILSIGVFTYSNTYAQSVPGEENPDTCPICGGREAPVEDQECYQVNIGGTAWCQTDWMGHCDDSFFECP